MKYCITLAVLFCLHASTVAAQEKISIADRTLSPTLWGEGSILLNDGSELKGLVRYDNRAGLLSYENGDDTRSFTPRSVTAFEYFDEGLNSQRIFYTFPYEDPLNEAVRPQFFELLREFKNFTVLAKTDPLTLEDGHPVANTVLGKRGNNSYGNGLDNLVGYGLTGASGSAVNLNRSLEVVQTEIIYIMDLKNEINPYIRTVNKQNGNRSAFKEQRVKSKRKMLDESLLATAVTEPIYKHLEQFAKEKDLSFKYKDDLLQILDYYKTIE